MILQKNFLLKKNHMKAPIEGIWTYRLVFHVGFHIGLYQTLYVPSMSMNLISLLKLNAAVFSSKIGNDCFSSFKDTHLIGSGILSDSLYK